MQSINESNDTRTKHPDGALTLSPNPQRSFYTALVETLHPSYIPADTDDPDVVHASAPACTYSPYTLRMRVDRLQESMEYLRACPDSSRPQRGEEPSSESVHTQPSLSMASLHAVPSPVNAPVYVFTSIPPKTINHWKDLRGSQAHFSPRLRRSTQIMFHCRTSFLRRVRFTTISVKWISWNIRRTSGYFASMNSIPICERSNIMHLHRHLHTAESVIW